MSLPSPHPVAETRLNSPSDREHICHEDRMTDLECGLATILSLTDLNRPGVVHRFRTVHEIAEAVLLLNHDMQALTGEPLAETVVDLICDAEHLVRLLKDVRAYLLTRQGLTH